jgi:voltage-gated potassium channel
MILPFKFLRKRIKRSFTSSHLKDQLAFLFVLLFVILALHTVAMMTLERMPFIDALWLTLTTATTVGYGDLSAKTASGRIATIVLMYIAGIAIVAQVAGLYFELRRERYERMMKGDWRWHMKDHIVFLGVPEDGAEEYFVQGLTQLRLSGSDRATAPIVLVTRAFSSGLPERLRLLDVVHVNRSISDPDFVSASSLLHASVVVVMATNRADPLFDSINFELVDRLRSLGFNGCLIVEAVQDGNRARLKKAGASHVLRPIRTYPELLMRSILAPGSEQIIEELFSSLGEECIRYDVRTQKTWSTIVHTLTVSDVGVPIAYECLQGNVFTNPPPQNQIETQALFVLVRNGNIKETRFVANLLTSA